MHIGQRRRNGERIDWDCEWSVEGSIPPGGHGSVVMRLFGLPDNALQEEEHLEFYEGSREVAIGHVVSVQPPKATDGKAGDGPLVFVMRDAFDGAVITSVFHEEDGDWQFLTGPVATRETAQLVHRSHVLALDPTLSQLDDMPQGMWAHRHGPDQPWHIEPDSEEPSD